MDLKKAIASVILMDDIVEMKEKLLDIYGELVVCGNDNKIQVTNYLPEIRFSTLTKVQAMLFEDREGNYIPAIKFLREVEQLGLKEAKDIVDVIRIMGGRK